MTAAVHDLAVNSWLQHSPATYGVLVAAVAAVVGLLQLRNALRVRREQAQPSVVLFDVPSAASFTVIELVAKNFGPTPAYNVRITATPPLERSPHINEKSMTGTVKFPEVIRTLASGQEWRTVWDHATGRARIEDVPDRSEVLVTFEDVKGKKLESRTSLDWSVNANRFYLEEFGIHHAARALRSIDETLKKLPESGAQGVSVWVRSGRARDVERAARSREFRDWWESQEEARRVVTGQPEDGSDEQEVGGDLS